MMVTTNGEARTSMESGTQFEHPGSRPNSAQGRIVTAGRYSPALVARSKSTEPRMLERMPGKRSHTATPTTSKGGEKKLDRPESPTNTRFPAVRQTPEQTPFLLPLQRVYSPHLLLNHFKSMRSTSRMSHSANLEDTGSFHNRSLTPGASFEDGFPARTKMGETTTSVQPFRTKSTESLNTVSAISSGPPPSIFGTVSKISKQPATKRAASPQKDAKATSKDGKSAKLVNIPVEEVDTYVTSAKDLKEAKELFRQFDTDGDGTLTMSEIQASLYYNNVDFEEIQAILGPNGIKTSHKEKVSVEDFAQFLCRRRRENANRHQNFQISKHSRIMRVYVSSCLHQHHAERAILHEKTFTKLAQACNERGGELRVVDLRYHPGPFDASSSGPGQAEIMQELSRVATDTNHFFVGLIGDLPGECVLPAEISAAEYETLKASAKIFEATSDEKGLVQALENLYVLDKNSITQSYVLQQGSEQDVHILLKAFSDYDGDEKNLHSSFSKVRAKMAKSLSEQEFWKCHSLGAELDHGKRTFMYIRTIEDMLTNSVPETPSLQQIFLGKSEEEIMRILERQHLIKESIADACLPGHVFQYKIPCTADNVRISQTSPYAMKAMVEVRNQEYLEQFAAQVYESLAGPMLAKLEQPVASALQMELDAQITIMKRDAAAIFRSENDSLVKEIMDYVHGSPERAANFEKVNNSATDAKTRKRAKEELDRQALPNCPLFIVGALGSGRTALLARMAEMLSYSKEASKFALIYRCINATPYSSDGRLFLDGLCEELAKLAGNVRTGPRPPSYNALLVEYSQSLLMLSNKKPVILFLDGLDQLPNTDHCRRLSWLPSVLPDNVYIVCAALPNDPMAIYTYPKQNIKIMKKLENLDMKEMINHWLENYKQSLQENQKEEIIQATITAMENQAAPSVSPCAQLRLAFSEATNNVASFAAPDKLTEIVTKPGVLVYECLGLLLASIGGLTETELMQLLKIEEDCATSYALPYRRLHKLLQRIAPYTTSRERDSRIVIAIRHDSFKRLLLSMEPYQSRMQHWSRDLAEFYSAQQTRYVNDEGKAHMNVRKLRYVIYYQLNGEMWEEAGQALCSLVAIQAMCEAGMSVELQKIYTTAIRTIPPTFESKYGLEMIKIFYRFFTRIRQALEDHSRMIEQPGIIVQMAANEPLNTLPEQQAQEILASDAGSRIWMQAINKAITVSPLSVTLIGNKSTVRASHVSFDGSHIATSADGGNIRIWDAETGESITTLMGHTGDITVVMFLPSGQTLVSGSTDSTAKVWDEPNGKCMCTYDQHKAAILGLAVSPDGELVSTGCQGNAVRVWKLDGQTVHVLNGHSAAVRACSFSPDGSRLASASLDKSVKVWDLSTGKTLMEFMHRGKVYDVHFTKDSTKLISSSSFSTCTLWDAESGSPDPDSNCPLKEYRAGNGSCLSCTPMDGDKILCMASEQGKLYFWDMERDDRPLMELKAHSEIIHKVSLSLDGHWLVTSGADKVARVWNLKTALANLEIERDKAQQHHLEASHKGGDEASLHGSETNEGQAEEDGEPAAAGKADEDEMPDIVRSVAISEDCAYGVSCSEHGSLLVWDVPRAEIILRCASPAVARVVRFHPSEPGCFYAACDDGVVRLYNILGPAGGAGAQLLPTREVACHDLCIRALKVARDGSRFVTGSIDATACVWGVATCAQELCLRGHRDTVLDADLSAAAAGLVATSSTDKTVRVWSARTGKEQWAGKHAGYVYACVFTGDCKRVVSASGDRTARVWASKKGECLNILTAASALLSAALSEGSGLLMCAGYQGALHFWETRGYSTPPVNGVGHEAEIRCAEFSKHGSYAVTASHDQSVRLFDARTGASLGALPVQYPIYSMASRVDEERAVCMCGDEAGHVLIVRISGVRDPA